MGKRYISLKINLNALLRRLDEGKSSKMQKGKVKLSRQTKRKTK